MLHRKRGQCTSAIHWKRIEKSQPRASRRLTSDVLWAYRVSTPPPGESVGQLRFREASCSCKGVFTERAVSLPRLGLVDSDLIAMRSVARRLDYAVPVIVSPQMHPPLHRRRYAHHEPDSHRLGTRRSYCRAPGYG